MTIFWYSFGQEFGQDCDVAIGFSLCSAKRNGQFSLGASSSFRYLSYVAVINMTNDDRSHWLRFLFVM
jgi:hypothetical protein